MRISTSQLFDGATSNMLRTQSDLYKLQNQISTGRKVLNPSDDPVAAAQALVTTQQKTVNDRYADNQANAKRQLALMDTQLGAVTDVLQEVMQRAVEAGNGAYNDADKATLANDLQQRLDELMGLANSSDAEGKYMFSGYRSNTQPFANNAGSFTYNGDDGVRQLQVNSDRMMDVSASGNDVFMRVRLGNGSFSTAATSTNTGTGVIDTGTALAGYSGIGYTVTFTSATTYSIQDTTTLPAPAPVLGTYTAGSQITVGNVQFSISGAPATGDSFTIAPSANQSIFKTVNDMITALRLGTLSNPVNMAKFQNAMMQGGANLKQALDQVLTVRTATGTSLSELDSLSQASSDLDVQYQQTLSDLQDLDYTKAISDLSRYQLALQAAQQSFVKVTGMSLFDFLQ